MTCTETESRELLDGHIVALGRGSQLRVRLEDGREIRAIPVLEALEKAPCPNALIFNRPVQVRMYKHPKLPRRRLAPSSFSLARGTQLAGGGHRLSGGGAGQKGLLKILI